MIAVAIVCVEALMNIVIASVQEFRLQVMSAAIFGTT
jgi:hypothetical protein